MVVQVVELATKILPAVESNTAQEPAQRDRVLTEEMVRRTMLALVLAAAVVVLDKPVVTQA
jgi:hypothetical protein